MAFQDGMKAVIKTLEIGACVLGVGVLAFGVNQLYSWTAGIIGAVIVYMMLWTPAWIIKKFIQ